jgi:hypothetical protein
MNKKRIIDELTNVLSAALRHKIGSIVNSNEIYAQKYAKDAEVLLKEAEKIAIGKNWNMHDKAEIKDKVKNKLKAELEKKQFLDNKKFEFIDDEVKKALKLLNLL